MSRSKSHSDKSSKKKDVDKKSSSSSLRSESSSQSLKKDSRKEEVKDRSSPSDSSSASSHNSAVNGGSNGINTSNSTNTTIITNGNPAAINGINNNAPTSNFNDAHAKATQSNSIQQQQNIPTNSMLLPSSANHNTPESSNWSGPDSATDGNGTPQVVISPAGHALPGSTETMPQDLDVLGYASNGQSQQPRLSFERYGIDGIKTPKRHNSSRFEISEKRELVMLPDFTQVPAKDRNDLFFKKIEQCTVMFDFNDPSSDIIGKDIKQIALSELLDYFSTQNVTITQQMYSVVVSMFAKNIFRHIPPPVNPIGDIYDPDEDDPICEVAWPHMQLVYDFFLKFIESSDFNQDIAKRYIDHKFVQNLIDLFDSEDPRERDCLKTTLHRIYGKFLTLRSFIRRAFNNVFFRFLYETERFNGIPELLEILGSIINGFALPLKDEHKIFLSRVLIPLHKVRSLGLYNSQLSYCVVQFLEKDPSLTEEVVMGLLRYWPKVNSSKEVLFLIEVEEFFEVMEPHEFVKIQIPLFVQLAKCISSPHFQVAERALHFWSHEYFCSLVAENSETILPIIFSALHENSTAHWNQAIHSMIYNATKLFIDTNPVLYDHCAILYRQSRETAESREQLRKECWQALEQQVQPEDTEMVATSPHPTTAV